MLRDVYAAEPELLRISLPSREADLDGGFTLEHLLAVYPNLNLSLLVDRIAECERAAHKEGRALSQRRHSKSKPVSVTEDGILHRDSITLLMLISKTLDDREALGFFHKEPRLRGLEMAEIVKLGASQGWTPSKISALMDILIDQAYLLTRVEQQLLNTKRLVRTFKPDGELVSDRVRKLISERGLPLGI